MCRHCWRAQPCIFCGNPAQQLHHVVYRQELRRHGGDIDDPANLAPVCLNCHGAHHAAQRRIPLSRLSDEHFAYAQDLLGAGPAYEYLRRRYQGEDLRLDRLLADWAAGV